MKKNNLSKVIALIALVAIILGLVGTGVLIIFSSSLEPQGQSISIEELQQLVGSGELSEESSSGSEGNK